MRKFILDDIVNNRGIGWVDLEHMSGVGRDTINKIRQANGQGRRRPTIEKIAFALGLTYEDLFENILPSPIEERTGFDGEKLMDIAEEYESAGNREMYNQLYDIAARIGVNVEELFDQGDKMYESGNEDEARGKYAQAILSLQPWHISRLKKSLSNYLDLSIQDNNVQAVKSLYDIAKMYRSENINLEEAELFYGIGVFFVQTRQPDKLVSECFYIVNEFLVEKDKSMGVSQQ